METIQIQYLDNTIEKLTYIDGKSDWIDLRSAVDVELKAGEFKLIHLGIAMKLPEGYEAHVVQCAHFPRRHNKKPPTIVGGFLALFIRSD